MQEQPKSNPDPTRCNFWVDKKKRFCTFQLAKGSGTRYCSMHVGEDPTSGVKRVPCPLNPNHTVLESDVAKHVKVCPDARWLEVTQQPYYCKGLHGSFAVAADKSAAASSSSVASAAVPIRTDERVSEISHRSLQPDELLAVWRKIVDVFCEFVLPDLNVRGDEWVRRALHIETEASDATKAAATNASSSLQRDHSRNNQDATHLASSKHAPQHEGLINAMRAVGAIPVADVFIELGAGKGHLSLAVAETCALLLSNQQQQQQQQRKQPPHIVVVDRGGFRRKADAKVGGKPQHDTAGAGGHQGSDNDDGNDDLDDAVVDEKTKAATTTLTIPPFQRVRIDMQDFDLWSLPLPLIQAQQLQQCSAALIGKHLCGCCTDFALSIVMLKKPIKQETEEQQQQEQVRCISSVDYFVVAPCCHHRCSRQHFQHLLQCVKTSTNSKKNGEVIAKLESCLHRLLPPEVFGPLASLSSWATCGHSRRPREEDGEAERGAVGVGHGNDDDDDDEPLLPIDGDFRALLGSAVPTAPKARERAGRICKLVLDWFRGTSLVASGCMRHFSLRPFLPTNELTKENWVILAST